MGYKTAKAEAPSFDQTRIWQELVRPEKGTLVWKHEDETQRIPPSRTIDAPLHWILIQENCLEPLDTNHFESLADPKFKQENGIIISPGESTGYDGLLRFTQRFETFRHHQPVNDVLLAGSMNHTGLYYVLTWLHMLGHSGTNVTLVDRSPHCLNLINSLGNHGYWKWDGKVTLVHSDIRDFKPNKPFDLALMDIVFPYSLESFVCREPEIPQVYAPYEQILRSLNNSLRPESVLFSRTFSLMTEPRVYPERIQVTDKEIAKSRTTLEQAVGNDIASLVTDESIARTLRMPWIPTMLPYDCGMAALPGWNGPNTPRHNRLHIPLDRSNEYHVFQTYDDVFGPQNNERFQVLDESRDWTFTLHCSTVR